MTYIGFGKRRECVNDQGGGHFSVLRFGGKERGSGVSARLWHVFAAAHDMVPHLVPDPRRRRHSLNLRRGREFISREKGLVREK